VARTRVDIVSDYGAAIQLPDEYRTPGVPFTRLTRPLATISNAIHPLGKHANGSPPQEDVTYFPKGFFGIDDDDVYEVMRRIDMVTYLAEPEWNERMSSWMFLAEIDKVRAVVPIRMADDDSGWEARTIWPDGGEGVRIYRRGKFYDVP